jgi:hypothetical protein
MADLSFGETPGEFFAFSPQAANRSSKRVSAVTCTPHSGRDRRQGTVADCFRAKVGQWDFSPCRVESGKQHIR